MGEHGRRVGTQNQQDAQSPDSRARSLLESMEQLCMYNPWEGRCVATSYPFPANLLVLRARRIIQAEIRWTLEQFIEEQRLLNRTSAATIRTVWESVKGHLNGLDAHLTETINNTKSETELLRDQLNGLDARLTETINKGRSSKLADSLFLNYPVQVLDNKVVVNERIVEDAFVVQNLSPAANTVLDLGCSESYRAIQIASLGFVVYGIDVRDYGFCHPNFHFLRDDFTNTPFADEFFDIILSISALEHVGLGHYGDPQYAEGDKKAMKEISRILSRRGKLILSVPFGASARTTWERIYDNRSLRSLLSGFTIRVIRYWTKDSETWRPAPEKEALKFDQALDPETRYPLWRCIACIVATKQERPTRKNR